ncbi:MAG: 2-amino-4-hydroxy-6-hydroxymethyldihydropteridine diphosphokinase [Candidatus Auribacterota bacterium]|nr:2-amino-4-hydroxy-6-hydroxymethyldihydropteridine diphosphokinase [Candidatus Auribacterota bacterium]
MRKNIEVDTFISLGSNRADRVGNIRQALLLLGRSSGVRVRDVSSLYESEPMYLREQDLFLNCVAIISTTLEPYDLLAICQEIEKTLGRRRTIRYGPRLIDLDIISYGRRLVKIPGLTIPHVGLPERRFVLQPIFELAPYWRHPGLDRSVKELLDSLVGDEKVIYYGELI